MKPTKPPRNSLFSVRVPLSGGTATVTAYEAPWRPGTSSGSHSRVELGLTFKGKAIFPPGSLWMGIPGHQTLDGKAAKRGAVSTFAIKPGDTDRDFFKDYTPAQLEFVERYGEEISMFVFDKYGEG